MVTTGPGVVRRGRLFRKYVVFFGALVSGALLASGALEIYFSYEENKAALAQLQREKALAAASRIEQFVKEIERQIGWTTHPQLVAGQAALEYRRVDYIRLLRQVPAVSEVSQIDAAGMEQLRVSRLGMDLAGSRVDFSKDPKFVEASRGRTYFSPVYFLKGTEPYLTMAMAASSGKGGVTVAEVNLKFIWDVIKQIKIGKAGHAFVVDSRGQLIAHPDISLVLRKSDFSALEHVAAARGAATPGAAPAELATIARDAEGRDVLAAVAPVAPLGWWVVVEQPLREAFEGIRASIIRAAVLILIGIALSVLASLVLARRMVKPIQALQAGAARVGAGDLGHRIDVETGDELEALADQFNQTAAQLQESYANLEQKVDARTRELSEALAQQTATSEVLRVISSSPNHLEPVFAAVLARATELCDAQTGALWLYDGDAFELAAHRGADPRWVEGRRGRIRPTPLSGLGRIVRERRPIHLPDIEADEAYDAGDPLRRSSVELLGARTGLWVPMLKENALVGALVIYRTEVRLFGDKLIALIQTFADQAVIAIENVKLFREIENKNAQLEVANRHKSEFLANMSHELRTPLNAVIGFSEVLLARMFGELNDKQDEYLQDVLSSGRHLLSLINDILDLSKIEAGRMELELSTFDLPVAVDNALILVRERATRHGIGLDLSIDPSLGAFVGDERKIKQVLVNLLSNAVKFTPEGGKVAVRATRLDGAVEISVSDTGIGIAPEDHVAIFEEFRQVGTDYARKREGTGLGLALARRFAELHGGTLQVKSELGRGSTFTVTLPERRWPAS